MASGLKADWMNPRQAFRGSWADQSDQPEEPEEVGGSLFFVVLVVRGCLGLGFGV